MFNGADHPFGTLGPILKIVHYILTPDRFPLAVMHVINSAIFWHMHSRRAFASHLEQAATEWDWLGCVYKPPPVRSFPSFVARAVQYCTEALHNRPCCFAIVYIAANLNWCPLCKLRYNVALLYKNSRLLVISS